MMLDEEKKLDPGYGFNPVSRRYIKKTSDTWLRLVKAGVVTETPEALEELTLARRQKNRESATRRMTAPAAPPVPVPARHAAVATPPPAAVSRKEVRRMTARIAKEHSSALEEEFENDDNDTDLELRLRALLIDRLAPRQAPRARAIGHARRGDYGSDDDD